MELLECSASQLLQCKPCPYLQEIVSVQVWTIQFLFFTIFFFPSVQRVTTSVQTSQVFFLPFSFFSFLCMLKLVHVNYIWVHSTFSLFTNIFLYCYPTFFSGEAPVFLPVPFITPAPLWYSHSNSCHGLILGVQPGDQMRLSDQNQSMSMQNQICPDKLTDQYMLFSVLQINFLLLESWQLKKNGVSNWVPLNIDHYGQVLLYYNMINLLLVDWVDWVHAARD